ncbi:MAG: MFS transporter [Gemmataceae bacterium]|nr:MFS transporter [Gemmataceae bacterium]
MNDTSTDAVDRSGRWRALAAALLGWSFDGFEMGLFPVLARPALQQLLGPETDEETLRRWNAGFAIAFLLGAAVGGVVFGWLGDRIGRVRAMTVAVLVYAGLTGISATARSPGELAGWRFLAATGMGGEWALGVALVAETWPASARPWLAGLIGAAVNAGYVAAAALAQAVGPAEWRLLLALGAVPAGLTFFLRTFVPESDRWRRSAASAKPRLRELFSTSQYRNTLAGIAAAAVPILAIWGAVQFTQLWAASVAGPAAAARVQLVSALAAGCGAIAGPVLLAGMARGRAYALLCAAALVVSLAFFVGKPEYGGVFLLGVAGVGLFTGATSGWLALYLPELFPTRLRAAGAGLAYNAGRVLAAGGVALSAGPLDARGDYARACAVVSLVYAVGLLFAARLPDTRGPLPE